MSFKILPTAEKDCYTLAEIEALANTTATKTLPERNVSNIIFGGPNKASLEFREKMLVDKVTNDHESRIWKAVINDDENGQEKIVAWAHWFFYTEPHTIEWEDIEWTAPINGDGANELMRNSHAIRAKYMSGKRFGCKCFWEKEWPNLANGIVLSTLATLSAYRGNGIGSALIERGLSEARDLDLTEFWLDASEDGHDLYARFGFQDVEWITCDLEKYGGVGEAKVMTMRKVD